MAEPTGRTSTEIDAIRKVISFSKGRDVIVVPIVYERVTKDKQCGHNAITAVLFDQWWRRSRNRVLNHNKLAGYAMQELENHHQKSRGHAKWPEVESHSVKMFELES